jgi:hypothetical protein
VAEGAAGLVVTTHAKYLVDPGLADQVSLADGKFDTAKLKELGFHSQYKGVCTLSDMKAVAGSFSGLEKTGCHQIAVRNAAIIDCEIAFSGGRDRVDLAALELVGEDVRLVFWEAKDYSNSELRAARGLPPVCDQIKRYRSYLAENTEAIESSYKKVAKNLSAIQEMGWRRELSPLIAEIASGKRTLTLGKEPRVGLLIFGFDAAQKAGSVWKGHLQRLKDNITLIRPAGNAKNIRI